MLPIMSLTVSCGAVGSMSTTLIHALKQLHPDGNADMPAKWYQSNVAGNNGGAQKVLYRGRSV